MSDQVGSARERLGQRAYETVWGTGEEQVPEVEAEGPAPEAAATTRASESAALSGHAAR